MSIMEIFLEPKSTIKLPRMPFISIYLIIIFNY